MVITLRSFALCLAVVLGVVAASPSAHAQTKEEKAAAKAAAKVESIVRKATAPRGTLDKLVDSYDKKVDKLVRNVASKVDKMRRKGMPEEMINEYINDAIMNKGMVYAQQTRDKLTSARDKAERSLVKYGSPAAAVNAIRTATDEFLAEVDEIWEIAADDLHGLEAI